MTKKEYLKLLRSMSTKTIARSLNQPSKAMLNRPMFIKLHKIVLRERGHITQ